MVMLGKITKNELLTKQYPDLIPKCFDPDQLTSIHLAYLAWYDEIHIKQEGDTRMWDNIKIHFPHEPSVKYEPESNLIVDEDFRAAYNYAGEAHFCFGCAKVHHLYSTLVGLKCKVFDYSGKRIASINEQNLKIREEIKRVKSLKSNNSHWVVNN